MPAPVYGAYRVSEWPAGEVMPDRIWLQAPDGLPAGTCQLFVGMYDAASGKRVPLLLDSRRLQGDTLGLADITVE